MKGFNALCFLLAVCVAAVACQPAGQAQAGAPSVGTYLGQAGYSSVYQIKADGITCIHTEWLGAHRATTFCVARSGWDQQ